jgi:hypothetical protein
VSWIWEENVQPLLEFASECVGYKFDSLDWDAVRTGLEQTDYEAGSWFDYDLVGTNQGRISLAQDVGSSVVFVRFEGDAEATGAVRTAMDLMAEYFVVRERPQAPFGR